MIENYPKSWLYVAVAPGSKTPVAQGWQEKQNCLTTEQAERAVNAGYSIALAHAYSNTCSLDIDDYDTAVAALRKSGIELDELLDDSQAVHVVSGKANHFKLLYTLDTPLTSRNVKVDGITSFELRCATATGTTVADMLPPSRHPDSGQNYEFVGDLNNIRPLPDALRKLWLSLTSDNNQKTVTNESEYEIDAVEIERALSFCDADCSRDEWIRIAMSLSNAASLTDKHDEFFTLFDKFSSQSTEKYKGERDTRKQFDSLNNNKNVVVTIASLFQIAAQYGYHKIIDAAALFANVAIVCDDDGVIAEPIDDVVEQTVEVVDDCSSMFGAIPSQITINETKKTETMAPEAKPIHKTITLLTPEQLEKQLNPGVPSLDTSIIPAKLLNYAEEVSVGVGCDVLVPIFAGLGAVCAAVDSRSRLELKRKYAVPPVLWLMTLGNPSDKKSPGSKPMLSILKEIEKENMPNFKRAMLKYEAEEAVYASNKKAFIEHAKSSDAMMGADAPHVGDSPTMPAPLVLTVTDTTSQKLVRTCADNPRGVMCSLDEMANWIRVIADKNSSENRSAWVVAYEADSYKFDRVGAGSIFAENMAVSICGNLQPDVYSKHQDALATDGLIQRFIPAILDITKTRKGVPVHEIDSVEEEWNMIIRQIYATNPTNYTLSGGAYSEFDHFQSWCENMKQCNVVAQLPHSYTTAFGKIEGTCARIALVFHLLDNPLSVLVSEQTMSNACRFVTEYIVPALKHVHITLAGHGSSSVEGWLADHLLQCKDVATLTVSDIRRSARSQIDNSAPLRERNEVIINAANTLVKAGWLVTTIDDNAGVKNEWAINPAIYTLFTERRKKVIEAKQSVMDNIYVGRTEKHPTLDKKKVRGA
jgi:hypothetical protein